MFSRFSTTNFLSLTFTKKFWNMKLENGKSKSRFTNIIFK